MRLVRYGWAAFAAIGLLAPPAAALDFNFDFSNEALRACVLDGNEPDVDSRADLVTGRAAGFEPGGVRLTPAEPDQVGTLYTRLPIQVSGFSTRFAFRIGESGGAADLTGRPGGDGLAFVIQTESNLAGNEGGGMGFAGLRPSVAVEFDTFVNPDNDADLREEHVGIMLNGVVTHAEPTRCARPEAAVVEAPGLDGDGEPRFVWIDYDGSTLEVRIAREAIRPPLPIVAADLDIPGLLDRGADACGIKAFVGFSAATGQAFSRHAILSWAFKDAFERPASVCGNGGIETGKEGIEACDDGNTADGDGCSAQCRIEPGFYCTALPCTFDPATGLCDPEFVELPPMEGCPQVSLRRARGSLCLSRCGDGVVARGEACDVDDAEPVLPTPTCNIDCSASECGDGKANPAAGEACDDGNLDEGDGCSPTCGFEGVGGAGGAPDGGLPDMGADGGGGAGGAPPEPDAAVADAEPVQPPTAPPMQPPTEACVVPEPPKDPPPGNALAGGGCSAAPGVGGTAGGAMLLLLLVGWRRRRSLAAVMMGLVLVVPLGSAEAQNTQKIDVQTFRPSPFMQDLFMVQKGETDIPFGGNVGFVIHYMNDPLVLRQTGSGSGVVQSIVEHGLTVDALAAMQFADWFGVGIDVPVILYQDGDDLAGVPTQRTSGVGDLRLHTRLRMVGGDDTDFALAFAPSFGFPSSSDRFFGRSGFTISPAFLASLSLARVGFALNAGALLATDRDTLVGADQEHSAQAALGGWFVVVPEQLDLVAELVGSSEFSDFGAAQVSPISWHGGIKWHLSERTSIDLGGGGSVSRGIGAPAFRLFAGLRYAPANPAPDVAPAPACATCPLDSDNDGLIDSFDKCPNEPEDRDGYKDDDGCPDPDTDDDGVPDDADKCIDEAEDIDGFEDDDGCPDPDNDVDKLCDPWVSQTGQQAKFARVCTGSDNCPDGAEVYNGVDDDDGCPDSAVKLDDKKKQIIILQKVLFFFDKTKIKPESFPLLDEVVNVLHENPWILKARIEGHTDERGNARYNKKLSEGRAIAVMKYMLEKGIDPKRLSAAGLGKNRPIVRGAKTEDEHQRNRRVEFHITRQARRAK